MNVPTPHPLPAIDDDIAALLDAMVVPPPLPAAARQRIKQRLLRRVAGDTTPRHLTLQPAQGDWQPFGPGLQIKVLHEDGGIMSYLVRLAAGARLPPHRHPVDEECVVLEGEITIGSQRFGAGTFHLGRRDVLHDSLASDGGALIFLRGAAPELDHLI
jgi:anti-sigma factor ChrR (cupin superfamily)